MCTITVAIDYVCPFRSDRPDKLYMNQTKCESGFTTGTRTSTETGSLVIVLNHKSLSPKIV